MSTVKRCSEMEIICSGNILGNVSDKLLEDLQRICMITFRIIVILLYVSLLNSFRVLVVSFSPSLSFCYAKLLLHCQFWYLVYCYPLLLYIGSSPCGNYYVSLFDGW